MNTIFEQHLRHVLNEEFDGDLTAAVGIVRDKDRWLLGLARNTNDDRSNKWVFPGGHIKRGETPAHAVAREVKEETGVRCRAVGEPIFLPSRKGVAFFLCKLTGTVNLDPNSEFAAVGFFTTREMRSLKLYDNVKKLIDRVKRRC